MTTPLGLPGSEQETSTTFRTRRAIEAMCFSLLGTSWLILGVFREFGARYAVILFIALATAFYVFRSLRAYKTGNTRPEKAAPFYFLFLVCIAIFFGIVTLINALAPFSASDWSMPVFIFLTGLSFLLISKAINYPAHSVTGLLLMLGSVVYPFLSPAGPSCPSGCFGASVCFWGSALYGQRIAHRRIS